MNFEREEEDQVFIEEQDQQEAPINSGVVWNCSNINSLLRKTAPNFEQPVVREKIDRGSKELEVFLKVFSRTLFIKIVDCTNNQIKIYNRKIENENKKLSINNCHTDTVTRVKRTNKKGEGLEVPCPEAIAFDNKHMGGVDLSDQFPSLYDPDRKSGKW